MTETLREQIEELQRQWAEKGTVDAELAKTVFGDPTKLQTSAYEYKAFGERVLRKPEPDR
jgi:hypothetical protein